MAAKGFVQYTESIIKGLVERIKDEIALAVRRFEGLDLSRIERQAVNAIEAFKAHGNLQRLGTALEGEVRGIFLMQYAFARTRPKWFAEMFADELRKDKLVLESDLQRRFEKHLDRYRALTACGVNFDLDEAARLHALTFEVMTELVNEQKRINAKRAERAEAERKERELREAKERVEAEAARKRERRVALANDLMATFNVAKEPREIAGDQGTQVA